MILRPALVPQLFEVDQEDLRVAPSQVPEASTEGFGGDLRRLSVGGKAEFAEEAVSPAPPSGAIRVPTVSAQCAGALAFVDVLSPEKRAEARQVVGTEGGEGIRRRQR